MVGFGEQMDDRQAHRNRGTATKGASMIVVRPGSVLMVERSRPPNQGLWSFPAGRAEPGEDAEANARRELKEETGLSVGRVVRLGSFRPGGKGAAAFDITVFAAHAGEGVPVAGDDAAKAEFVPLDSVSARPTTAGAAGWIERAIAALAKVPPR
jgi:ADP-ribose pyrophosphatase YjhB (NUDIX family)